LFAVLTRSRRRAIFAVVVVVLIGLPLHVAVKLRAEGNLLAEGKRAPVLQGPTLDGGSYDSTADRGRVVVLSFVDPEYLQGAALAAWQRQFAGDEQVRVVTVLIGGSRVRHEEFVKEFGLPPARVVVDHGGTRREPFRVEESPTTYIIDPLGAVAFAQAGVVKANHTRVHEVIEAWRATARKPRPESP
jgi:peroxiredoxin